MMFEALYVELTSLCNMSCEFCCNPIMPRPKIHMDFKFFCDIIDEIASNNLTRRIQLAAVGESLLYPRLFDAIKYCKEKGFGTSIFSNGLLLTTDIYQKLVDAGLNELLISFHDLTEASFEHRHSRPRVDYSEHFQNLIRIIDYHIEKEIPIRLVINLMFCKDQWISSQLWDLEEIKSNTRHALPLLQDFLKEMSAISKKNRVKCHLSSRAIRNALKSLNVLDYRLIRIMRNVSLNCTSLNPQLFNIRKKLSGAMGEKLMLIKKKKGFCNFLGAPMILSDGSFIPCCVDGLQELVMGKLDGQTSLVTLINSKKYQNFISEFKKGNILYPTCQECRGRLEYRDLFLRLRQAIISFDPHNFAISKIYKYKHSLKDRMNKFLKKPGIGNE